MNTVYIEGFGVLHTRGIYSGKGFRQWDCDQSGAEGVKRAQVLSEPLSAFGRLPLPDRLAFSAASLALCEQEEPGGDRSAICLGIPSGSFITDIDFIQSVKNGFPSPSLFSATLPSSPVAEIAIHYKFKGPCRVFSGGNSPSMAALDSAWYFVKSGRAEEALSIGVWTPDYIRPAFAFALFLSSTPSSHRSLSLEMDLKIDGVDGIELEQDLFMHLAELIMYSQPVSISVNRKGFRGYISLEEQRKEVYEQVN
jgi:hypothetical protein